MEGKWRYFIDGIKSHSNRTWTYTVNFIKSYWNRFKILIKRLRSDGND